MGLKVAATSKSAEAPDIDAGMYDARFEGVIAKELEKSQFDPEVYVWTFTLFEANPDTGKVEPIYMEDDPEPLTVDRITSRSTNTKSKTEPGAVKVLKALMSDEEFTAFVNEEESDTDDLIGRMVQVQVVIKENGWPTVETVLPAKREGGSRRRRAN